MTEDVAGKLRKWVENTGDSKKDETWAEGVIKIHNLETKVEEKKPTLKPIPKKPGRFPIEKTLPTGDRD